MSGYSPRFCMKSFPLLTEGQRKAVIKLLLNALTGVDMGYLLLFPGCPLLYDSGIRYVEEPPGRDDWQDIAETLERQEGDCEDLACWRVAELRVRLGERAATHVVTVQDLPDPRTGDVVTTYHIAVRRADGRLEDPSRLLGMKG